MRCKKSRELLLTDYLDGEMGGKERLRLEKHLAGCPECKKFSLTAGKVGPELFSGAARAEAPEYLWRRVREVVLAEQKKALSATGIFAKVRAFLYMPRPVLAVATIVVLILAVGTFARLRLNREEALQLSAQGQVEYLNYLAEPFSDVQSDENAGFGTQVEKYFL